MFRTAIIAGVGALGAELAQNVGRLKPRCVVLVDHDVLELKNIPCSSLWKDAEPSEAKVHAAAQALGAMYPETRWIGMRAEIADLASDLFRATDVLFGAVDTDLARTEMAAIAARYGVDICDGGLGGTSLQVGRVSWFPHQTSREAACFSCLLSARRRALLLSSWEPTTHPCLPQPVSDVAWSSAPSTAQRIARLQAAWARRMYKSVSRRQAQTLQIDLEARTQVRCVAHQRSEECPFHDDDILRDELFPHCSAASCVDCRTTVAASARPGWIRRWGRCPGCGGRQEPEISLHHEPAITVEESHEQVA